MSLIIELLKWIIIICIFGYLWSQRKPKNFPPGPRWGFPILGHLPLLGAELHKPLTAWKRKYGPIIGIDFGPSRAVIISDYKLIKEAMNLPAFAGRPKFPAALARSGGQPEGIILTEGRQWREQRRFTIRHLRDFGFGSKSMETIVQVEVAELIEKFKQVVNTPISTTNRFNSAVVNALWTIVAGQRFEQDDPKLNEIIKCLSESFGDQSLIHRLAPLIPLFGQIVGFESINAPFKHALDFIQPYIDHHMETHVVDHPRDFMDSYIDEMKRTEDPDSSFHPKRKNTLLYNLLDLFMAGAESTSTTLSWICLYMATYATVQEKLAAEIQRVVGNCKVPCLADRPSMPYTEAVIHEVMRVAILLPLSAPHSTTEHVAFHGFELPKDTLVFPNLYEVYNNKELWGDPENFRPERFLSSDESGFVKHEGFVPFTIGKRVCPGEALARDELFLFTASLFQTFHVGFDSNGSPPSLVGNNGDIYMPKPHQLVFSLRQ